MSHPLSDDVLPAEGELTSIEVDGTVVALARVDGTVFAVQDACTHAQCSLSEGEVEGRTVVCPCHSGVFDLPTGAVVSGLPKEPLRTWTVRRGAAGLELS